MTVRLRVLLTAAVLGVLAALLVACGDRSRLIPSGDAGRLQGDLDNLQNVVSSGDCERVRTTLQRLQDDLVQLPSTVDIRLRNRIQEGVAALTSQAPAACADAQAETTTTDTTTTETTTETETTDTETTPTETTPTETTPTETTPTETTPTETTPTETTPPPTEGTGGAGVPPGNVP